MLLLVDKRISNHGVGPNVGLSHDTLESALRHIADMRTVVGFVELHGEWSVVTDETGQYVPVPQEAIEYAIELLDEGKPILGFRLTNEGVGPITLDHKPGIVAFCN